MMHDVDIFGVGEEECHKTERPGIVNRQSFNVFGVRLGCPDVGRGP
jgi:hypothetical protein